MGEKTAKPADTSAPTYTYECTDCGARLQATHHPPMCASCGGEMQNISLSREQ